MDAETAAARSSVLAFTQRTFPAYRPARHHQLIAEHLEAVERGVLRRLIIETPPRHGKSELVSVRFPAWYLGRNPAKHVIASSYAADLAYTFSRQCRNLFAEPVWPFPASRLAEDNRGVERWATTAGGGLVAAGVGGGITGFGADLLILDDPLRNREDADSELVRGGLWEWWTSTARTRLHPGAAVVLCQTRWHEDDLAGRLLADVAAGGEQWTVLRLPAIAEDGDLLGRAIGEALWPEWYDVAALDQIRRSVGSRNWAALYQQRPTAESGGVFQRSWWRYYRPSELPARFDEHVLSFDMAFKDLRTSDYVVGQRWARLGANCYLLNQIRGRLDFPRSLDAVRLLAAGAPPTCAKLVEDAANGPAVIQVLRQTLPGLIAVRPEGGKLARAHAVSPVVEAGNVYLPDPTAVGWAGDLVEELSAFPAGAHDDQVDALTLALGRLSRPHVHAGLVSVPLGPARPAPGRDPESPVAERLRLLADERARQARLREAQ